MNNNDANNKFNVWRVLASVSVLIALSFAIVFWAFALWKWWQADPSSFEPLNVLLGAIISILAGILGWMNSKPKTPGGPSLLEAMISELVIDLINSVKGIGYRKRYLQSADHRYSTGGTGSNADFYHAARVYVEPALRESARRYVSEGVTTPDLADPSTGTIVRREEITQTHSIWDFLHLSKQSGRERFVLAVVGGPGFGKTALLHHVMRVLSSDRGERKKHTTLTALPILISLRDHAQKIIKSDPLVNSPTSHTLAEAIDFDIRICGGPTPPRKWFARQLEKGNCLVMMDGLDEIIDTAQRRRVTEWLQREWYRFPDNQYILTSRPVAYQNAKINATLFDIQPLDLDRIRKVIANWYSVGGLSNDPPSMAQAQHASAQKGRNLYQQILHTKELLLLAQNPLMLILILNVYDAAHDKLPHTRAELLEKACRILIERRELPPKFRYSKKEGVLSKLAYAMMHARMIEASPKYVEDNLRPELMSTDFANKAAKFLDNIREGSGLIVRPNDTYLFAHQLFQYYFAARCATKEARVSDLKQNIDEPWWHETIRFYCAMNDATPIVSACLDAPTQLRVKLAIECISEAAHLDSDIVTSFGRVVGRGLRDKEIRLVLRRALAEIRNERLFRVSDVMLMDTEMISNIEYQVFLFDMYERNRYCQPDHWTDFQYPDGQTTLPVVGVHIDDALAFCEWLNKEESQGRWRYRLPTHSECKEGFLSESFRSTHVSIWAYDGRIAVCPKPAEVTSLSVDDVKRRLASDLASPPIDAPSQFFHGDAYLLPTDEALALVASYDPGRSRIAALIEQMRLNLFQAARLVESVTPAFLSASSDFERIAAGHQDMAAAHDQSLFKLRDQLKQIETRRDAELDQIAGDFRQQYAGVDMQIAQIDSQIDAIRSSQDELNRRVSAAYKQDFGKITRETERLTVHIADTEAAYQRNRTLIREHYARLTGEIEEKRRLIQENSAKNQQEYENHAQRVHQQFADIRADIDRQIVKSEAEIARLRALDPRKFDVSDAMRFCENVIDNLQTQRNELAGEENVRISNAREQIDGVLDGNRLVLDELRQGLQRVEEVREQELAELDRKRREVLSSTQRNQESYNRMRQELEDKERAQNAEIESTASKKRNELLARKAELERSKDSLHRDETSYKDSINRRIEPSLRDVQIRLERLQSLQESEVAKGSAARAKATKCKGFGPSMAAQLKSISRLVDELDTCTKDFFGACDKVRPELDQSIQGATQYCKDVGAIVLDVSRSSQDSVVALGKNLAAMLAAHRDACFILEQRGALEKMMASVVPNVENCDPVRFESAGLLDSVSRPLRITANEIESYLRQHSRQLNLRSDLSEALERWHYMRLIVLVGAMCLLRNGNTNPAMSRQAAQFITQYVKLLMIVERASLRLPAFEGIRVIKEFVHSA